MRGCRAGNVCSVLYRLAGTGAIAGRNAVRGNDTAGLMIVGERMVSAWTSLAK
jgi:hypothetical protein